MSQLISNCNLFKHFCLEFLTQCIDVKHDIFLQTFHEEKRMVECLGASERQGSASPKAGN